MIASVIFSHPSPNVTMTLSVATLVCALPLKWILNGCPLWILAFGKYALKATDKSDFEIMFQTFT